MYWLSSHLLALCLRARPASIYIKTFEVPWEQLSFASETMCCSSPCQCCVASSQPCQMTHCWGQPWRVWPAIPTCLLGHPGTSTHHLSCFFITVLQTGPSRSAATPAHLYFCPFLFGIIFFLPAPHCFVEIIYFLSSHLLLIPIFSVVSQIPLPNFRFLTLCSQFYSSPACTYYFFLLFYPTNTHLTVLSIFLLQISQFILFLNILHKNEEDREEVESPKTFVH